MDSVDSLKKDLAKLKSVLADKKQSVTKNGVAKPEISPEVKPDAQKPPFGKKPDAVDQDKEEEGDDAPTQPAPSVFKKKANPLVKKDDEQDSEEEE